MRESQFTQADQLLNDFDDRGLPFSAALARQAAEISQSVINNTRLADLVRQAETEARTSDDCVWLGQLLTRLHRDAQAEKALRTAIDREPANEDAWVALARCTRLDGRTLHVDALVAEAGQRVPPARRALTAARCYEAAELADKAQRQYELACQSTAPDSAALAETTAFYLRSGQTARATSMLRRLLKTPDLDSGRSAWARRKLARNLAISGDYDGCSQALELIETNLSLPVVSDEDRRGKAQILAKRGGGRARRQALDILTRLERQGASSSEDRSLLAELDCAEGDWPRAKREMQHLMTGQAPASLLAGYLECLLAGGDMDEAAGVLQRLEQLEPDADRTLRLKVRLLLTAGKAAAAVQAMDHWVQDANEPALHFERLGVVAEVCDEAANRPNQTAELRILLSSKAEAALRRWMAAEPVVGLRLAPLLCRLGQTDEAIEVFEQACGSAAPSAISAAIDRLVHSAQLTVPQLSRIRAALDQVERSSGAPPVWISQAHLASLAGDYRQAEALYRRTLNAEPRHLQALENLSLVRALAGGQQDEALELVNQAVQVAGPSAELLELRGTIELAAGRLRSAQDDLENALADLPSGSVYFHLAQLWTAKRDIKRAKAAMDKAHQLGLKLSAVHPLEQGTYQRLSEELAEWSSRAQPQQPELQSKSK